MYPGPGVVVFGSFHTVGDVLTPRTTSGHLLLAMDETLKQRLVGACVLVVVAVVVVPWLLGDSIERSSNAPERGRTWPPTETPPPSIPDVRSGDPTAARPQVKSALTDDTNRTRSDRQYTAAGDRSPRTAKCGRLRRANCDFLQTSQCAQAETGSWRHVVSRAGRAIR